jgi:hypothetical protein
MSQYDIKKVKSVRCPKCLAEPGASCTTPTGKKTEVHNSRKAVVYPSFNRGGQGGLKRGSLGTMKVYLVKFSIEGMWQGALVVTRTEVDAEERLRLALSSEAERQVTFDDIQVTLVTEGKEEKIILFPTESLPPATFPCGEITRG